MQQTSFQIRLPLGHGATWHTQRTPRRGPSAWRAPVAPGRFPERIRGLPRWVHGVPYAALVLLGAGLLMPGVVPRGPGCGEITAAASAAERELFIDLSAVAFGMVALLLLLSVLVASAQRRLGRPGLPTIVSALLLGSITLVAVISPHAPAAAPVQAVMVIDVLGLFGSGGAILAIPAVAAVIAWKRMRGPRSLRRAQILAWATLVLALPLIMALTYLTVSPICFD